MIRHYDTEHCYNSESEKFDARKLKVDCPNCGRNFAALCSKKTEFIKSTQRYFGCDDLESVSEFKTTCTCGNDFRFATCIS